MAATNVQESEALAGRVAWITGAGGGIGRALALALARAGARVAGCDRDAAALQQTAEELVRLTPGIHHFMAVADVTASSDLEPCWRQARAQVGLPHVLVANAGVTDREHRAIADLPEATWEQVIAVNLTGAFHTLKTAYPYLRRSGGANVLIVSSLLGQPGHAVAGDAAYIASKAGLEGLKAVAALEWAADGINVNSVYPARKVATGFFTHLSEAERAALAPPTVLDEVVIFLASVPPGRLTGASVDGRRWLEDPAYREELACRAGTCG